MPIVKHFTATGFVVHDRHVALHWHLKVGEWLPPGGHIQPNEDPVQAVVREVLEETGIEVEVVPSSAVFQFEYPSVVHPPLTILLEDIYDPSEGYHQPIDMIYVCRPINSSVHINDGWIWVSREQMATSNLLEREDGIAVAAPQDVRVLAVHAFDLIEK